MKTINIAKKEFEDNLIKLFQESNIPACILTDILEKYLRQLEEIAKSDYERDLKNYQQLEKEKDSKQNIVLVNNDPSE